MGTVFSTPSWTDEKVKEQLFRNFRFFVGEDRPVPKGKNKNAEGISDEDWFRQLIPVHGFIFCQAFHEATARGILNAFEQQACQEVFDML